MKAPISCLKDADMQAAPNALMRAAETARRLAEQTGTPFVVRQPVQTRPDAAQIADVPPPGGHWSPQEISHGPQITSADGTTPEDPA